MSTERLDFLYLDPSEEAITSVELNGVGGGDSKVGGRGPLLVLCADSEGNEIFIVDPSGFTSKVHQVNLVSGSSVSNA